MSLTAPDAVRRAPRWKAAGRLLGRRMLLGVPVTLAITAVVFALASIAPFNPLAAYVGSRYQQLSLEQRAELAGQLGLDQGWFATWTHWLTGALQGDWGTSILYARPVTQVMAERLPYTLLLAGCGLAIAILLSIALAIASGRRPGGLADKATTLLAQLAQSLPPFVLALVAVAVFALRLGMPASGVAAPGHSPTAASIAWHLVLPACVLAFTLIPWLVLNLRASIFEALESDAVLAARGRGAGEAQIMVREVLPLALLPFVTVIGSRLGELVTGALLIESVFSWPGIASATVEAAKAGDFPLLAAVTMASCLAVFAGNALADACYLLIDPRVKDV
ncbi:ABC transporter permease [Glutamicibacter uratoxydans]|uniref:ABC transporter permease n=1 Tax=Glutamicibacter uratoxydans TaxID=43667 RepID=A0A4Y4DH72_GLUUR|nr:ABC transporter permease [Glutamicibacter uratoxydans]GED04572.1 ABC transporter permease [Glutamicibacter uratoxydans]